MSLLLRALLIFAFIALNAFFAAAEYALLSVRRTRLEELAREGSARARAALGLLGEISLVISGTQLGVTVVSLMMGWLGEDILAAALEQALEGRLTRFATLAVAHLISSGIAFVLITVLLMVLGELVPKALAYSRAEQAALVLARPMALFLQLSRYPVRALNGLGNLALRALGQRLPAGRGHGATHTPEEVKLIVSSIRKHGLLGEEQEEMIHGVFDLHRMRVSEIMVPRPRLTCFPLLTDLGRLLDLVVKDQHSRVPVYEGTEDHIIGILHTKDLLQVMLERSQRGVPLEAPFDLRSVLHPPMIVPETMPLNRVLEESRRKRSQMALVVDEFGTFIGLATLEDVVEQIVGEIQDEYDQEETAVQKVSENVLVVDASTNLRDLAEGYDLVLPQHAGYETLAGFVLARLGAIPRGGETFVYDGRRYTVLKVDRRRVAKVKVEKLPASAAQPARSGARPTPAPLPDRGGE